MLILLSKAVLAVVVTQTPLIAFTSHTGTSGGVGVGTGTGVGEFFLPQDERHSRPTKNGTVTNFTMDKTIFITNKIYYKT